MYVCPPRWPDKGIGQRLHRPPVPGAVGPSSGPPTEHSPHPPPAAHRPPCHPRWARMAAAREHRRGPAAQGRTVSSWGCEVKARTFLSVGVPRRTRDRRVRWPTTQDTSTRCRECRCTCQIWTGAASQRSLWGQSQEEAEKAARRRGQEGARTAAVTLLRGRLGDCSPGVTWTQGGREGCQCGLRSQATWAAGTANQAQGRAVTALRGRPRPGGQQAELRSPASAAGTAGRGSFLENGLSNASPPRCGPLCP